MYKIHLILYINIYIIPPITNCPSGVKQADTKYSEEDEDEDEAELEVDEVLEVLDEDDVELEEFVVEEEGVVSNSGGTRNRWCCINC